MRTTTLGRTGLNVTRTAFGALPIQRLTIDAAAALLQQAREAGINYFDTARDYSDSEYKMGVAFKGAWDGVVIATKTSAKTADKLKKDLELSLNTLGVDCIDVYQFHNPPFVPVPGGEDGLYDAALEAKRAGKIRHIGITQHTLDRAFEAVESGLYDTLQYPFNHLSNERDTQLVRLCAEKNVGFVGMKALSGGLITDARISFAFLTQHENVVPIWGVQRPEELRQLLALDANPPAIDEEMRRLIAVDREELAGAFCRSCGYCLPCPVGIPIHQANRMTQLLNRAVAKSWLSPEWQENMAKIEQGTHCGACARKCPYSLKPYETLPGHLKFFRETLKKSEA